MHGFRGKDMRGYCDERESWLAQLPNQIQFKSVLQATAARRPLAREGS